MFIVAQNIAKYTKREVQTAVLAKQFRERMGLMSSKDALDMVHHGMIEDCPVNTHDLNRETAIWNKSLSDLKSKETRRSTEYERWSTCSAKGANRAGATRGHYVGVYLSLFVRLPH